MPGLTGLEVARLAERALPRGLRDGLRRVRGRGLRAGRGRLRDEAAIDAARLARGAPRQAATAARAPPRSTACCTSSRGAARPREYLRWINASQGNDVRLITVDEVRYFQSDTKYTRVVTAEQRGADPHARQGAGRELDPAQFWQIHRATHRERERDRRRGRATFAGRVQPEAEGAQRDARGERAVRAPVPADVTARCASFRRVRARWRRARRIALTMRCTATYRC